MGFLSLYFSDAVPLRCRNLILILSVKPDDIYWVYCTGVRQGSEADWELAWARLQKTEVLLEKQALLRALACTTNTTLLLRYLDRSIDPNTLIRCKCRLFPEVAFSMACEQ